MEVDATGRVILRRRPMCPMCLRPWVDVAWFWGQVAQGALAQAREHARAVADALNDDRCNAPIEWDREDAG